MMSETSIPCEADCLLPKLRRILTVFAWELLGLSKT